MASSAPVRVGARHLVLRVAPCARLHDVRRLVAVDGDGARVAKLLAELRKNGLNPSARAAPVPAVGMDNLANLISARSPAHCARTAVAQR